MLFLRVCKISSTSPSLWKKLHIPIVTDVAYLLHWSIKAFNAFQSESPRVHFYARPIKKETTVFTFHFNHEAGLKYHRTQIQYEKKMFCLK